MPPSPQTISTTCPYCGVGCGVLARPNGGGGAGITGDPDHPANFGRLCSKGYALNETLDLAGRLLHPMRRQPGGGFERIGWDVALGDVAQGFARIVEQHGPAAIAFYLSGQLLTEDYYVANKLMKGFLGSANVDTNSRLCMASAVAAHQRAFGEDVVPCTYNDVDVADLIVLVGSNTAWCHPVLFQRMLRNRKERGAKIVLVDPRRTVTGQEADLFLPIAPGMDSVLFSGLLVHLADNDGLDRAYIDDHTSNFDAALRRAREIAPDLQSAAARTALDPDLVLQFFDLFARTTNAVTCFSQGVNQSAQGTDKANAIINCHLAAGRIGKPGAGPFSLTGQPNAMGGREVGGLANQLAAHMRFDAASIERVQRFWNAPQMATEGGLKAVQLFDAIKRGEIKALWVMGTNPAVSMPEAGRVARALAKLKLFVVSENMLSNDSVAAGAHILLPAAAWGEKDGTVTNSERCISRQRAFLPLPGEVKPDWWIVSEVARRMGFADAFPYSSAADIFREHAALSSFENAGTRAFDIGGLASISDRTYSELVPVQWPLPAAGARKEPLFSQGGYFTPSGKANFVFVESPTLDATVSAEFPLRLNTGRVRDQWHTMTRSGKSIRLAGHSPEPFVEVHPRDAARYRIKHDGFARVTTRSGTCVVKVVVDSGQQPGSLFVPIHWNGSNSAFGRVGDLVAACCDPVSDQPELKATPAAIMPVDFKYQLVALAREPIDFPASTLWVRFPGGPGIGYLGASNEDPSRWRDYMPSLFGLQAVLAEYVDRGLGIYRAAAFLEGKLHGCLFVAPAESTSCAAAGTRASLPLPFDFNMENIPTLSDMPIVCACFDVSLAAIGDALKSDEITDAEAIGRTLRAGTKCGTCLPELRTLVSAKNELHVS